MRISPDSAEAEAFRTVRTGIFFGAPKDQARTILVTSPASGEGKSTTASNLAVAMAQAGQRVLVIDADFRRPMQHSIFKTDPKVGGFSSLLAGAVEDLEEAVAHTGTENLDILPCGPKVSNPAELLNSDRCARIVEDLGRQYDRVIIDSPPVVAVTDAQILATICDIAILVVRAEVSTRRVSMQARDSLASVEAHLLGVIVNDVPRKGGRYGYYGGYGYDGCDGHHGSNSRGKRHIRSEAKTVLATCDVSGYPSRHRRKYEDRLKSGVAPGCQTCQRNSSVVFEKGERSMNISFGSVFEDQPLAERFNRVIELLLVALLAFGPLTFGAGDV